MPSHPRVPPSSLAIASAVRSQPPYARWRQRPAAEGLAVEFATGYVWLCEVSGLSGRVHLSPRLSSVSSAGSAECGVSVCGRSRMWCQRLRTQQNVRNPGYAPPTGRFEVVTDHVPPRTRLYPSGPHGPERNSLRPLMPARDDSAQLRRRRSVPGDAATPAADRPGEDAGDRLTARPATEEAPSRYHPIVLAATLLRLGAPRPELAAILARMTTELEPTLERIRVRCRVRREACYDDRPILRAEI
jgi:hypothetical protein